MYATIEQTNTYVAKYYSSTDPVRTTWEGLSDDDKQVQLNKAERLIDQLPYSGKPCQEDHAFPRDPGKERSLIKAQEATILLALTTLIETDTQMRIELQKLNVKSYRIGDLSETFGNVAVDYGLDKYVYSIVFPVLREWLGGGYRICPTRIRK